MDYYLRPHPQEAVQNLEVKIKKEGQALLNLVSTVVTIPFFGPIILTNACMQDAKPAPIWIWTLERLPEEYQKNECLKEALRLAESIAKSRRGQEALRRVNIENADLGQELQDGTGPELELDELDRAWGEYRGDSGGKEDAIYLDKSKLDKLLEMCKDENKKKDAIIRIASTVLHETAHWKDDNKKHPDDDTDTPGEEGTQLEIDIFGGDLDMNNKDRDGDPTNDSKLTRDRQEVDDRTKDNWANPDWWKNQ